MNDTTGPVHLTCYRTEAESRNGNNNNNHFLNAIIIIISLIEMDNKFFTQINPSDMDSYSFATQLNL